MFRRIGSDRARNHWQNRLAQGMRSWRPQATREIWKHHDETLIRLPVWQHEPPPPRSQCMHACICTTVHVQIVDPSPFPGPQLHHCMIHLTARSVYVTQEINGVICSRGKGHWRAGEKGEERREKENPIHCDVVKRSDVCQWVDWCFSSWFVLLYYCVLCMIHTFFTPTTRLFLWARRWSGSTGLEKDVLGWSLINLWRR